MAELFVAATPIGNLMDLTPRLAETLKRCDLIVAEDTRVTMKLLHHLGIKKPLLSMNRHTEQDKAGTIVERMLREDLSVCLTCDAGTPGISDPGVPLVAAAHEAEDPGDPHQRPRHDDPFIRLWLRRPLRLLRLSPREKGRWPGRSGDRPQRPPRRCAVRVSAGWWNWWKPLGRCCRVAASPWPAT